MGNRARARLHKPPEELLAAESMASESRCARLNRHTKGRQNTWSKSDIDALAKDGVGKIPRHPVSTVFLDRVSKAIQKGYALDIVYRDWGGKKSNRRIHPKAWVNGDHFTAFCELRHDKRGFRVQRMADCRAVT